jgi:GNAT superfamily N-acetyltransferase
MYDELPQDLEAPIYVRGLAQDDPQTISDAFARSGSIKPVANYRTYLAEQSTGKRTCFVATVGAEFAGYVTVNWVPTYPGSVEMNIPELQDLNVLPRFRRRGIATRLLDEAEKLVGERFRAVAIGVGLHPGYNAAQVLYVRRGYVPDGRGITYREVYLTEGAQAVLDDDLVLHLAKELPHATGSV